MGRAYVPKIFLFGWYRSDNLPRDPAHNEGLLDPSGRPKPAWIRLTRMLGGSPGGPDPGAPASS